MFYSYSYIHQLQNKYWILIRHRSNYYIAYSLTGIHYKNMINTNASKKDNADSPSIYEDKGYEEYRKKEKSKDAAYTTSSQNQVNPLNGSEQEEEGQTFQY
jgi:hypothetical protein